MTSTAWHDASRHRLGGALGFPDDPRTCTPGVGDSTVTSEGQVITNARPGWRKGASGVPAASDHSHPLEAVRMQVFNARIQSFASIASSVFSTWGNPHFTFEYTPKDESCALGFQYVTTFFVNQADAGAMFGIHHRLSNATYFIGQFDSDAAYKGRHYKNYPLDHTLAMGTIVIPAGIVSPTPTSKAQNTFTFMWQRYAGNGDVIVDFNDFAQITVLEYYST